MLRRPLLYAINLAYRTGLRPAWTRFLRAANDPAGAQAALLARLLGSASATAFGRDHGLGRVRTLADYQDAVPVRGYDEHAPWIDRIRAGEPDVLFPGMPKAFEKSSGSTRASKYIPYSAALLDEFSAATGPWLHDTFRRRPALLGGSSYWSISPTAREREVTDGGTRVGFEDDTEYFPPVVRRLLRVLLPVPSAVARLPDLETCRYATLCYLLADPELRFVSVWSPSFLTLLLAAAVEHRDALADDLAAGTITPPTGPIAPGLLAPPPAAPRRAAMVRRALGHAPAPDLRRIWPRLTLLSCWTDAAARRFLPGMRRLLPDDLEIQGKGLLATEGVVSFPLVGHRGAVLAVASHVIELAPAGDPDARPVPPHQAEPGGRYVPLLSTGGGLYRYRLGDEVEIIGRFREAPLCRFVGKRDGGSDLAGEKLSTGRVGEVLEAALSTVGLEPAFCMLTPRWGEPPRYVLWVEADAPEASLERLAAAVDAGLRAGHHYEICRSIGQLGPIEAARVEDGAGRYERALVAQGMKAGDIKPTPLHAGLFWDEAFGGTSW